VGFFISFLSLDHGNVSRSKPCIIAAFAHDGFVSSIMFQFLSTYSPLTVPPFFIKESDHKTIQKQHYKNSLPHVHHYSETPT
jgi:hypothetical protein